MNSLDLRTRTDDDIRAITPSELFDVQAPTARGRAFAPRGARRSRAEGRAVHLRDAVGCVDVHARRRRDPHHARRHRERVRAAFRRRRADLVNDLKTPMTFVTAGTLEMARGNLGDLLDWWVVLRVAARRPRGAHRGRGRVPRPRRLGRSTSIARSPPTTTTPTSRTSSAKPGSCTCAAGSIRPRWNASSADMDAALPTYQRDDGRSWWAKTADGRRPLRAHAVVPGALGDDGRAARSDRARPDRARSRRRLRAPPGRQPHRGPREADRRRRGDLRRAVAQGLLARHALVQLLQPHGRHLGDGRRRRVGPAAGRCGLAPRAVQTAFVRREARLPIDRPARPSTGDATVHCSCTLHMAQPPVERERKVMYTGFGLPPLAPPGEERSARRSRRSPRCASRPTRTSRSRPARGVVARSADDLGRRPEPGPDLGPAQRRHRLRRLAAGRAARASSAR